MKVRMKVDTPEPTHSKYPMPFVRLELVVLSVCDDALQVLLSHRKEAPFKGKWGLPGGVLRIDLDRSLEDGAQRVATERLNRRLPNLEQVAAVGGANRDPRAPWARRVLLASSTAFLAEFRTLQCASTSGTSFSVTLSRLSSSEKPSAFMS